MVFEVDGGLDSAIQELRRALDKIPHGEAKKLVDPFENLVQEATWMNVQRDEARQFHPNRRPPAYSVIIRDAESGIALNLREREDFLVPDGSSYSKLTLKGLRAELSQAIQAIPTSEGKLYEVNLYRRPFGAEAQQEVGDRSQLEAYLESAIKESLAR